MGRTMSRAAAGIILGVTASAASHAALKGQEHLTLRADVMLYGDNTEFSNPFREGETIFGAAVRPVLDVAVNRAVTVTLGALTNQRFGSSDAFELSRAVVAVTFQAPQSTFLIGTLPGKAAWQEGPDRGGPHGLLPPLQRETLTFERPYEAGLQWTLTASRLRHDAWINWQRLNTPSHRERFDSGVSAEMVLSKGLALPFQLHVVHEGGQLFSVGSVADSIAAAVGLSLSGRTARLDNASLETYAVVSRHVPDREAPHRTRNGAGFFGRAAGSRGGWRGHLLFWRGDDFMKEEGDPNYLSIRRDGSRYRGTRDYAEAGLAKTFKPAPGIHLEASGRIHRVEQHYEYSYRVLCVARLAWQLR